MTAYGPIYKCIKRFISVICAPRAHDKSEVGGTWPSVPHGAGAYEPHQLCGVQRLCKSAFYKNQIKDLYGKTTAARWGEVGRSWSAIDTVIRE